MADAKLSALSLDSVPLLADLVYGESGGTSYAYNLVRLLGLLNNTCQGRLTLTSGTAVTTSDVTGATSVYFTPYDGQCVSVYDGTRWQMYAFTELTLALGTLTSGANYDVFLWDSSGTLTLVLGPAWAGDTSRGTGAGTTELQQKNGVWTNKVSVSGGPAANAGRYLGTIRTTSTTATEDSRAKRYLWNAANRVRRPMVKLGSSSWTYNSATIRQANASTALQLDAVVGLDGQSTARIALVVLCGASGTFTGLVGIGEDSTTAYQADCQSVQITVTPGQAFAGGSSLTRSPAAGRHYWPWLEQSIDTNTVTFYGAVNGATYGLTGEIES